MPISPTNQPKSYSNYDSLITYAVGNVVFYSNQMYKCIVISLNNLPTNTDYWNIFFTNQAKHTISPTNQPKS